MTVADKVEALISRCPGLTEFEIAAALFGDATNLHRISTPFRRLMKSGRIERSGRGGRNDPFRYSPKGLLTAPSSPVKRRKLVV
jgi:hypothetical protein